LGLETGGREESSLIGEFAAVCGLEIRMKKFAEVSKKGTMGGGRPRMTKASAGKDPVKKSRPRITQMGGSRKSPSMKKEKTRKQPLEITSFCGCEGRQYHKH